MAKLNDLKSRQPILSTLIAEAMNKRFRCFFNFLSNSWILAHFLLSINIEITAEAFIRIPEIYK